MNITVRMLDDGKYEFTFEDVSFRSCSDAIQSVLRAETGRGPLIERGFRLRRTDKPFTQALVLTPINAGQVPEFIPELTRFINHYGAIGAATTLTESRRG